MPAEEPRPPHTDPPRASDRLRSSSAERERIATILRAAAEAGLLTLDEVDERLAACYQSQFRDQLPPLVADLPDHGRGLVPPDPEEQAAERRARRSAGNELGGHVAGVLMVSLVLIGIWAISGAGFFWPAWPLGFLALTLLFRAKHRARRYRWQQYAEHNGFPAHWADPRPGPYGGPRSGRHGGVCGSGHGPHRNRWWEEEHTSRP